MLKINYFASLRETLGSSSETLEKPESVPDVAALAAYLAQQKGEPWTLLQDTQQVLVAVDQTIVERSHQLKGDEEVAFFPPMTGG